MIGQSVVSGLAIGSSESGALPFGVTIGYYVDGVSPPDEQLTVKPE